MGYIRFFDESIWAKTGETGYTWLGKYLDQQHLRKETVPRRRFKLWKKRLKNEGTSPIYQTEFDLNSISYLGSFEDKSLGIKGHAFQVNKLVMGPLNQDTVFPLRIFIKKFQPKPKTSVYRVTSVTAIPADPLPVPEDWEFMEEDPKPTVFDLEKEGNAYFVKSGSFFLREILRLVEEALIFLENGGMFQSHFATQ